MKNKKVTKNKKVVTKNKKVVTKGKKIVTTKNNLLSDIQCKVIEICIVDSIRQSFLSKGIKFGVEQEESAVRIAKRIKKEAQEMLIILK